MFNFHLIYPSPSAESDYNDIVLEFDFTSQNETDCGIIFLVDDDIIEDTEELIITLNNGDEADFVNGTATVTILDDDGTSWGDKLVIQWCTWTLGMGVWRSGTFLENHK